MVGGENCHPPAASHLFLVPQGVVAFCRKAGNKEDITPTTGGKSGHESGKHTNVF